MTTKELVLSSFIILGVIVLTGFLLRAILIGWLAGGAGLGGAERDPGPDLGPTGGSDAGTGHGAHSSTNDYSSDDGGGDGGGE